MCLDQGRSVGGSAPADAYTAEAQPRHCRRNVFGSMRSFERDPLPVMHSACNGVHTSQRQPELGSSRSELRDPQRDFYLGRDVSCGSRADVQG
jgi:hypothetical protein